jgi:hypothetical protein
LIDISSHLVSLTIHDVPYKASNSDVNLHILFDARSLLKELEYRRHVLCKYLLHASVFNSTGKSSVSFN